MYFHDSLIPRGACFLLPLESKQEATWGWNFTKCISEVKVNQLRVKNMTGFKIWPRFHGQKCEKKYLGVKITLKSIVICHFKGKTIGIFTFCNLEPCIFNDFWEKRWISGHFWPKMGVFGWQNFSPTAVKKFWHPEYQQILLYFVYLYFLIADSSKWKKFLLE